MHKLTIRECTLSDAPVVSRLSHECLGYDYSAEDTEKKLSKLLDSFRDKIYVAVLDGEVVGYVHANEYDLLYAPHMKNIMGIAVMPKYRQFGIGRALLQKIEAWAKDTGAEGIRLVSGSERKAAHIFYEKCGYTRNKEQINFKKKL